MNAAPSRFISVLPSTGSVIDRFLVLATCAKAASDWRTGFTVTGAAAGRGRGQHDPRGDATASSDLEVPARE